ncbi:protein of unknown function [Shewanella benthica]|uniref:Uncharacterized protein n=1 Tax=Shewanella benthica TaxID=43661 RepID=A0A330M343_9GAMM|nr:protein of unknown function [Shewanella benthica]
MSNLLTVSHITQLVCEVISGKTPEGTLDRGVLRSGNLNLGKPAGSLLLTAEAPINQFSLLLPNGTK